MITFRAQLIHTPEAVDRKKGAKYYFHEVSLEYIKAPVVGGPLKELNKKVDNTCLGGQTQDLKLAVPTGSFIIGEVSPLTF